MESTKPKTPVEAAHTEIYAELFDLDGRARKLRAHRGWLTLSDDARQQIVAAIQCLDAAQRAIGGA